MDVNKNSKEDIIGLERSLTATREKIFLLSERNQILDERIAKHNATLRATVTRIQQLKQEIRKLNEKIANLDEQIKGTSAELIKDTADAYVIEKMKKTLENLHI